MQRYAIYIIYIKFEGEYLENLAKFNARHVPEHGLFGFHEFTF